MSRRLWLGGHAVSHSRLYVEWGVDEHRHVTTYSYGDVDFSELERRYGGDVLRKLIFHIAAFEANKGVSLAPEVFDLGPYADLYSERFELLWRTVVERVWAQWRYESGLAGYRAPRVSAETRAAPVRPAALEAGPVDVLYFCGGGKDSLVAMKMLERAGIPFASLAYSHSAYGAADGQFGLIDALLDHGAPVARHRLRIEDTYPGGELRAETPASVFAALPIALAHGYRRLAVAHERSADTGNLVWERTGEEVNHQWGKSLEAELLLGDYVSGELVQGMAYFSALKPLHDPVIFAQLLRDLEAVPATHSCNVEKPWCGRCPKCAYVWLGYMAYLPAGVAAPMFRTHLLDAPENQLAFRQMLGLEERTPFECVGMVDEARMAFELCRRKGIHGAAMDVFEAEVAPVDLDALAERLFSVDIGHSAIPADLADALGHELAGAGDFGREAVALAAGDSLARR